MVIEGRRTITVRAILAMPARDSSSLSEMPPGLLMLQKANFKHVQYRNLSGGIAAIHSGWKI